VNEALRLDYLQAMGVDSYVPRFLLDGAAASPLCEMDFPVADYDGSDSSAGASYDIENEYAQCGAQRDSEKTAASPSQDQGQSRSRIAADLEGLNLNAKAQKRAAPESKTGQNSGALANAALQSNPAFKLDLVGTGIGLLLVADTSTQPLSPAEKRLLANIAVAVKTHHKVEAAPTFSSAKFQWPVAKNLGLAQGVDAAKDALLGNIMAHAERQNAQCVIVFGEQMKPYFEHTVLSSAGLTVLFSASPAAMLADGSLKAALWQQLRNYSFPAQGSE
jgi:hypothetical protein